MFKYSEYPPKSHAHVSLTLVARHNIAVAVSNEDLPVLRRYGQLCLSDLAENMRKSSDVTDAVQIARVVIGVEQGRLTIDDALPPHCHDALLEGITQGAAFYSGGNQA